MRESGGMILREGESGLLGTDVEESERENRGRIEEREDANGEEKERTEIGRGERRWSRARAGDRGKCVRCERGREMRALRARLEIYGTSLLYTLLIYNTARIITFIELLE